MAARLFVLFNMFWCLRLDCNSCHCSIAAGTVQPCSRGSCLAVDFCRIWRLNLNGHCRVVPPSSLFGNLWLFRKCWN
uniref:Putative secreted protein n=1 Tax=Ixodes ricinus TaxID=34613 RepID=A0A6B0TUD7_IXORI